MDVKAYIDSGILEQFVLGNTSPEETAQVIELSKIYPEIKSELDAIESALIQLAESSSVKPSANLKEKIMQGVFDEEPSDTEEPNKTIPLNPMVNQNKTTAVKPMYNWSIAASLLLLGVSLVGNIWLYSRWKKTENELVSVNLEKSLLTNNDKIRETKLADLEQKLATVLDPKIKSVRLNGLATMPNAFANIYWDTTKSEVYLTVNNLPPTTENEQYQLWAIVDGKPQDAGVFNASEALAGLIKMKNADGVKAFAVTIEKKGGSINPTLEKMVLMGEVI